MTLHAFRGSSAYELQIGKFVFQVPRKHARAYACWRTRFFHAWIDDYGKWI